MSIKVIEVNEQPDGSAQMVIDMDENTVNMLVESAIITALEQYVDNHKNKFQLELDL
jgi:hypothetical protein